MAKLFQQPPTDPIVDSDEEQINTSWDSWFSILSDNIFQPNYYSVAIDVASVIANTTVEQTFTVPGVKAGDFIISLVKPSLSAGLGIVGYRCSADDTIAITYINATGSAIDPASETYIILTLSQDSTAITQDTLGV